MPTRKPETRLKREVIVPDPEVGRSLKTARRRMQVSAVDKGRKMIERIRHEEDRFGEPRLVNWLDVVEVIERLIHAIGPT